MNTSDPGYDAGAYVDEMAALNGKLGVALGELHVARQERDRFKREATLAEGRADRLKVELDRERSSRQAWAAEAMRLDVEFSAALKGEARARQECNELHEEVSTLRRELENVQQAFNRTFGRLYDIETQPVEEAVDG